MLSALLCSLHIEVEPPETIQQPVLVVMENTMPLYKLIRERYCGNVEVMNVIIIIVVCVELFSALESKLFDIHFRADVGFCLKADAKKASLII